jgi:hypothetical protein
VTLKIPGDVGSPRLLQLSWDGTQYLWKDITSNVSPSAGTIDGAIGSDYLGVLAVASSAEPSVTVSIAGKGFANGSYYVDLRVKSVGTRTAYSVSLDQVNFRVESGNGTIKYDPTLSAPLPKSLGNLSSDSSTTVRLYLKASTAFGETGVKQFSLSETIGLQNANGVSYSETYSQEIVP